MLDNISLLSCTFNNNKLTNCMIASFRKQVRADIPIIIVDNGTTETYNTTFQNVTIVDNQFYKLSNNYNQISRNHCASIEYAIQHYINTKYVILCDNDILFKPEINELLSTLHNIDAVGEIDFNWRLNKEWRIFPFFCIINAEKMKTEHIHYFDESRCMNQIDTKFDENGNWLGDIDITHGEYGDTGSSFLWDIQQANWHITKIALRTYTLHFAMASWNPTVKHNVDNWLNYNKQLWI